MQLSVSANSSSAKLSRKKFSWRLLIKKNAEKILMIIWLYQKSFISLQCKLKNYQLPPWQHGEGLQPTAPTPIGKGRIFSERE